MTDPSVSTGPDAHEWTFLLPLFREINDLKRVRSPELQPSIAAAWFRSSAQSLFRALNDVEASTRSRIAYRNTANVVAATRLGAISVEDLEIGGLPSTVVREIRLKSINERKEVIPADVLAALLEAIVDYDDVDCTTVKSGPMSMRSNEVLTGNGAQASAQNWIDRLIAQPRAGATAPGQPRIVLEPVESCAEHCLVTAAYAVLLAPSFGADPGDAFAIGLAHHLHNAYLPDAGFAGEALIGNHLDGLIETLREVALETMSSDAASHLRPLLSEIAAADTQLARTFHTADTIDRVLQIEYFARCNRFTLNDALLGMELVHAGPVQEFQQGQLNAAGLGDT